MHHALALTGQNIADRHEDRSMNNRYNVLIAINSSIRLVHVVISLHNDTYLVGRDSCRGAEVKARTNC